MAHRIQFETVQPPRPNKDDALDSMHQAVATMRQAVDDLYSITSRVRAVNQTEPRKSTNGRRK